MRAQTHAPALALAFALAFSGFVSGCKKDSDEQKILSNTDRFKFGLLYIKAEQTKVLSLFLFSSFLSEHAPYI